MQSILYIHLGEKQIPELELYQIYMGIYKQQNDSSDKELILVQVGHEEDHCSISIIKKETDPDLFIEGLSKDYIIKEIPSNKKPEEVIGEVLEELEEKYLVYILMTSIGQAKLVSKYVDQIITIKKEELVRPL